MEYQDFIKIEDYKNDITRIIGEINVITLWSKCRF